MWKAAEDALLKAFFGGFEETNLDLKNASYYCVDGKVTEIDTNHSLEDTFERNLERCTKSFSFMEAVT